MTDKELYSRAFRLYTSRLWGELLPDDIFAIEFSDGSLGYVSMEDMPPTEFIPGDEHRSRYSMFLYLGENGIRSLLDWADTSEGDPAAALAGKDGHGPEAADEVRLLADGIIDDAYTHVSQEYLILEYVYREDVSSEDLSDMVTAASMLHLKNRHFQYIPVFSYP